MWVATVKAFINQSIADDVESKKEGKSTNVDRENRALVALRNLDDRDVPPLHTQLLVADLAYNRHVLGHPPGKLAQRHAIVVPSTAKSAILPKQALALRRHDQQLCLVESNAKDGVAYVRDAKQLSVRQVLQTDQTEFDETTIQFDELKTDYFVFVQVPWSAPRCVIFITAQFTNRWCVPLTVMTGLPPSGPAPASSEHSWLYGDDSPWETDLKQASLVPFASITLKKPGLPECAFYSRFFHEKHKEAETVMTLQWKVPKRQAIGLFAFPLLVSKEKSIKSLSEEVEQHIQQEFQVNQSWQSDADEMVTDVVEILARRFQIVASLAVLFWI